MLVYGDSHRSVAVADSLASIRALAAEADRTAGLARHDALVAALIEAGALAQGVADAGFAARGEVDDLDPAAEAALAIARVLAAEVAASWRSGFREPGRDDLAGRLAAFAACGPPERVASREPEGFAHYAVYPEAYLLAAAGLPPGPLCCIGIRSIGTSLAAMVAASRPDAILLTLRPTGHPFRRTVSAGPALRALIAGHAGGCFAVVDEGPGLSGSSVAAVIVFLLECGAAQARIHVLPSHRGEPGPEAGPEISALWSRAPRHVATFDDVVLAAAEPAHRLTTWFADLIGPARAEPVEITGGGWRAQAGRPEVEWPPVHPWAERRKFLVETATGSWLLRFAGLGTAGREAFALAERCAAAGFSPAPAGLRHGFIAEPWLARARPLDPGRDRTALVERVGAYLAFRATLPAPPGRSGASVPDLAAMLRHNAVEALGPEAETSIDVLGLDLAGLEARRRPVLTDNRLHVWEWLDLDGAILKTDAVDGHRGHDLVGPQHIGWDVAGAASEFALTPAEVERLIGIVDAQSPQPVDRALLRLFRPAYLAFQLGSFTMAAAATADRSDRARLAGAVERYRTALAQCLQPHGCFTRPPCRGQGPL